MITTSHWCNPPEIWSEADDVTRVRTDEGTDFWRHTHYGFVHDSGHFRYREVIGDFAAEVTVKATYAARYDQAGLMLRHDSSRWIKAGVEIVDDCMHFCVVVTNQLSDWSLIPIAALNQELEVFVYLQRIGDTVSVSYRVGRGSVNTARVAPFPYEEMTRVGLMCCSPKRAGLEVEFHHFKVGAARI